MAYLAQLEAASSNLSAALEELASHYRNGGTDSLGARPPQLLPTEAPSEVHKARESALASLTRLQVMLAGPTDLLQNLAGQVVAIFLPTEILTNQTIGAIAGLYTMAWRQSSSCLYSVGRHSLDQGCFQSYRGSRKPAQSGYPNGHNRGIPPGTSTRPCVPQRGFRGLCDKTVVSRRSHVFG